MGKNSLIEWCDHSHNFWKGCSKVSPGCKFCYAEKDFNRWKIPGGFNGNVTRCRNFRAPIKWHKKIGTDPAFFAGMKIFTCSWSDFFIEAADEWRPEAWEVIRQTPKFIYFKISTHLTTKQIDFVNMDQNRALLQNLSNLIQGAVVDAINWAQEWHAANPSDDDGQLSIEGAHSSN